MNILQYQTLLNILDVQIVSKKYSKISKIKWSNNSSFFILIFEISKYRSFYISYTVKILDQRMKYLRIYST